MKKDDLQQILAYSMVGVLSVSAAFIISLQFIGHSRAQTDDEMNSLQTVKGQQPNGQATPPAANAAQTPPGEPQQQQPQQPPPVGAVPPPPPAGIPPGAMPPQPPPGTPPVAAAPKGSGGDLSELEGFLEPFIYDVVNRRDPFQAWAEYVPQEGLTKQTSPAQRFDLEQLKLVGIMWDVKDPKAMFIDPDQEVIVLGRDEGIGNKSGYIASIREGEVVVVEATRKRGDLVYKTRTLRIER